MEFHQCQPAASLKKRVMLCLITCLVLILPATGVDSGITSAQGQTFTIAGRITEVTPSSGPPIPGVTVTLVINSSVQRTAQTNANGDFTFADVAAGSNFEVTPSKAGFVFQPTSQGGSNLNQNRMLFFTGAGSSPSLQLVLEEFGPDPNQVAAVESPHFTRDPFVVVNPTNVLTNANDRNTRVLIFVTNLQLAQEESAASVVVNLVDSLMQNHNIPAESVRSLPDFAQVMFRLPDNLAPGTCSIKVTAKGLVSNIGTLRIKT